MAYPQHPPTTERAMRRSQRGTAALTIAVMLAAMVVTAGLALFAAALLNLTTCDREFTTLSRALPDDAGVKDLESRFPDYGEANTGCDEDDNTASADVEFQTGLDRVRAVQVGGQVLTSNGWDEIDRESSCFAKQIRGHEVFAQFPPPGEYDDPGTDLIVSLNTGQCWPNG